MACPYMGHECVGAAMELKVALALGAALFLCFSGPSVLCRTGPLWWLCHAKLEDPGQATPKYYQLHSSCRFITEPAREIGFPVLQLLSRTGLQIHLFFLEQAHSLKDAVLHYSKSKVKRIP